MWPRYLPCHFLFSRIRLLVTRSPTNVATLKYNHENPKQHHDLLLLLLSNAVRVCVTMTASLSYINYFFLWLDLYEAYLDLVIQNLAVSCLF